MSTAFQATEATSRGLRVKTSMERRSERPVSHQQPALSNAALNHVSVKSLRQHLQIHLSTTPSSVLLPLLRLLESSVLKTPTLNQWTLRLSVHSSAPIFKMEMVLFKTRNSTVTPQNSLANPRYLTESPLPKPTCRPWITSSAWMKLTKDR